eukprot:scaffold154871_cov15-Tisochrysis_lutea.AAC.2
MSKYGQASKGKAREQGYQKSKQGHARLIKQGQARPSKQEPSKGKPEPQKRAVLAQLAGSGRC